MDIYTLWAPLNGLPGVWAESLRLVNFRNHIDSRLQPGRQFNLISGPNGSGKTSVLDALHFLCVGRGFSAGQDQVY
ncbi:MAG: AAA family ATPase, partial [Flavobacteriales bacterium]|nr:AAA family ATPase [Flavobacteriales bacterium]MDW8410949.1 AAA family ATPase [Flavobacteriales bacterium]